MDQLGNENRKLRWNWRATAIKECSQVSLFRDDRQGYKFTFIDPCNDTTLSCVIEYRIKTTLGKRWLAFRIRFILKIIKMKEKSERRNCVKC